MKMWEVRQKDHSDSMRGRGGYRYSDYDRNDYNDEECSEDYEKGYEDGYRDAMRKSKRY